MRRFAVIMAGGSGERFWPASRRARPKQLLPLTDASLSMLDEAIERISPLIPPEDILIVTSELLAGPIAHGVSRLPRENVIAEPEKRNTAACLALAAAHLEERHGAPSEMVMAVLTADHQIGSRERFRATVDAALRFAAENDALVTIGVLPTRAETGYGYIEVAGDDAAGASALSRENDASTETPSARRVLCFREKPDPSTAEQYVRSGRHYWNSGMFFWRVATFLQGLKQHMPDLFAATHRMIASLDDASRASLREIFAPLADVSVDVGLMEQARNVYMIPAVFPWDDIGAWDALERSRPADSAGNVIVGDPVVIDTRNCIVFNDAGADHMAVAVVGVDNLIVATTPDGVLVCAKENAQDVRRVVAELRARQRDRFT